MEVAFNTEVQLTGFASAEEKAHLAYCYSILTRYQVWGKSLSFCVDKLIGEQTDSLPLNVLLDVASVELEINRAQSPVLKWITTPSQMNEIEKNAKDLTSPQLLRLIWAMASTKNVSHGPLGTFLAELRTRDPDSLDANDVRLLGTVSRFLIALLKGVHQPILEEICDHFSAVPPFNRRLSTHHKRYVETILKDLGYNVVPEFRTKNFIVDFGIDQDHAIAVSYTHLTLPTIYSV
eukprot:TRINITY_DN12566_c0_g1_i2.p1 TRINITY_DN12566_c0_g1~~TRINITY_DN12566_c0_g1_i2.p1  ORF type:complete len:235 (-),score=57.54 TRINITY_DN12566_c0_g1_i2:34-738(-)